jgi:hypothetical protein
MDPRPHPRAHFGLINQSSISHSIFEFASVSMSDGSFVVHHGQKSMSVSRSRLQFGHDGGPSPVSESGRDPAVDGSSHERWSFRASTYASATLASATPMAGANVLISLLALQIV